LKGVVRRCRDKAVVRRCLIVPQLVQKCRLS
jgi:hypothetical protein